MKGISSIEDIIAIEQQGMSSDFPQTTYDLIKGTATATPDANALSFFLTAEKFQEPEKWTYQELLQQIHQTANFFNELGANKDSVIAFILPNLPETHFVIWGGEATGIVMSINPMLEAVAMIELLNSVNASILVSLSPFKGTDIWEKVGQIIHNVPSVKDLVLVDMNRHIIGLEQYLALAKSDFIVSVRNDVPCSIAIHDFHLNIARQNSAYLDSRRLISPDDYSSFFCTGGTTGLPKIAMRNHRNEINNAWSAAQVFGDCINEHKTFFCGLPLFHVNAVTVTGLLPFSRGAHVVLGSPQGYRGDGILKNFWKIIEHYQVNIFSGVPTLYASLLEIPIEDSNLESLEIGLCGAAPLPVEIMRDFTTQTGIRMIEGYGLTEGTCISSLNPPLGEEIKIGSIGLRLPNQAMKAVILDEDGKFIRDSLEHEIGIILICGDNIFNGYLLSEQNKNIWVDLGDTRRWFNTGDLGYQDADGYFYLTGRKKELIIRGGHNIDPQIIEEPISKHPEVALVAAVACPDKHAGELPIAYVQLKEHAKVSSDELMNYAQQHIHERAAIPKKIKILDKLPLTAVGKIYKVALKHQEIKDVVLEELMADNIGITSLEVVEDKMRGTVIKLQLDDITQQANATRILNYYAFHFDINDVVQVANTIA